MEASLFSILYPLTTSILLIFLITKLLFPKNTSTNYKLPPGPWKLPIIGSMHHLMGDHPHLRMRSLAKKYGPLFHLKLGEVDLMVITSPQLAAESMKTHDVNFAARPQFLSRKIILYNSDLVFASYGKHWSQLRKICTLELFSNKRVNFLKSIMEEEGHNLVEKIRLANGSPVNVTEMLFAVANTTITRAAFGKEFAHQERFLSTIKETFKYLSGFNLADLFPSLNFLGEISGLKSKLDRVHRVLDVILNEIFQEHERKNANKDGATDEEDIVDILLRLHKEGGKDVPITMDSVKGVILDLFLGGTETTAATMDWAMAELIRHPEVMRKAQLEVRRAMNGRAKIKEDDINNLPYLNMVIKETLRLRTPAPFLVPRHSTETVELGGYTIPAGSRMVINVWAIMREQNGWEDAEIFQPERFENNQFEFIGTNYQYIPFGGGRRVCPGINYAMSSMENVLANLLYHFDWKLPGEQNPKELEMKEVSGLSLTRKSDLFLIATPHN
ncbi:hypothetical protein IEQ34_016645 [Dendrobium chrysotoxum]|uniref:Cytochrome P450 n=1 Tax=Dendrobium chrysotoxum TaxID=161865 RepID=A0AAV7GE26_DENCH|nr:hypothetical protein IEQ34_016645 [Dendrobium chrysotoxum]